MINIEILINIIGLLIIDFGAFAYVSLHEKMFGLGFMALLLGNIIGGILYKYSKN